MRREGIDLIAPISNVIGFTEGLKRIGEIRRTLGKAKDTLIRRRPDTLVLIDYPDFNLSLAKEARSAGIPVLYYVSPQVWAWRKGRVKKIAALVNRIALLFPFEVAIYREAGLACEYVGHPLAELTVSTRSKEKLKNIIGLDPNRPVITLLPGSRPSEIRMHLPVILEVSRMIREEMPDFQVVIPVTPETDLTHDIPEDITVLRGQTREALASSEASAIASGTATLEAALLGTPMVVFYRLSVLSFLIAKLLIHVKHISLVNILAGQEIVRELIQKQATPSSVFQELRRILAEGPDRLRMIVDLKRIREVMGEKKTSSRVAEIVGVMAGWTSTDAS
jgi:lipid-A-disaccharide synthase